MSTGDDAEAKTRLADVTRDLMKEQLVRTAYVNSE
jgi:hypothetical protein